MKRNSFLISHAFHNYLRAALLYSACMQLTVMIDAMVAGHFIGPDALTAINLALPLTTFAVAICSLIGLGPAILVAKAIGKRNTGTVNSIFSAAMYQAIFIGTVQGIILYLFLPQVGSWLCSNEQLLPVFMEYIQVMPFTFFLMMIAYTLVSLIEADGHPNFATKAVALGSLTNVALDLLLVKFFDVGIKGLALAMLFNYLSVSAFLLLRMKREGISYRWTRPRKKIVNVTLAGLKEGTPIMFNELLYSLMLFGINFMLLNFCGEREMFFWAIFLQILLLVMVIVDCAEGAMLSIGSVLDGEGDIYGLRALVKRSLLHLGGIVLIIAVFICIFPAPIASLFVDNGIIPKEWPQVARILSLMLIPFAITTFMRSVFQVLGNRICGILFSLSQLVIMMGGLYLSLRWNAHFPWWSFPLAAWILFAIQFIFILVIRHNKRILDLSIIPLSSRTDYLDLSVAYDKESVAEAIQSVCTFLQNNNVNRLIEMEVNICCEELMMNIVMFQTSKRRSYMDLSVVLEEDRILLVLKDSGREFNPIITTSGSDALEVRNGHLGLLLVNRVCSRLSHKYMYGLNVVFAEFDKQQIKN